MTDHTNDEREVRCPVDGCDATPLARGINLHVMRSSGGGHGPRGEVPETISFENLETVGEREVEMDYPEERDNEKHARLCPYCSQTFAGIPGLMIHLGQKSGRDNHPENPKERHEPREFPRVEADAEGNIERVCTPSSTPTEEYGAGAIPVARVFRLVADLLAENEVAFAERVRGDLIGVQPETDKCVSHPALLEALIEKGREEPTDHRLTAALEGGRIRVNYRDESGSLTATDAREYSARLRRACKTEGWRDATLVHFIGFLERCAEILEGNMDPSDGSAEFNCK